MKQFSYLYGLILLLLITSSCRTVKKTESMSRTITSEVTNDNAIRNIDSSFIKETLFPVTAIIPGDSSKLDLPIVINPDGTFKESSASAEDSRSLVYVNINSKGNITVLQKSKEQQQTLYIPAKETYKYTQSDTASKSKSTSADKFTSNKEVIKKPIWSYPFFWIILVITCGSCYFICKKFIITKK